MAAEFDEEFYRSTYPDIGPAQDPLRHFMKRGWKENRDPSPDFSTRAYLEDYADVRAARINPFYHFIAKGRAEGRNARVSIARARGVVAAEFDEAFYRSAYPDLKSHEDPLDHFITSGWKEGRDPNPSFSTEFYNAAHPDVAQKGINPFFHYLAQGRQEGRATRPSSTVLVKVFREEALTSPNPTLTDAARPRVAVVAMVKNEGDIIEVFSSHALALFDTIVFIDHNSQDGTLEFVKALSQSDDRVIIYRLTEPGYIQAEVINFVVRSCDALKDVDWIFLLDADEFLPFADRDQLHATLIANADSPILSFPWANLIPCKYWEDQVTLDHQFNAFYIPHFTSSFEKIAYQPRKFEHRRYWIAQGNHLIQTSMSGEPFPAKRVDVPLFHLPVRSINQLLLKLNQGVISYLKTGRGRNAALGTHWFRLLTALDGEDITPLVMNRVIHEYGRSDHNRIQPLTSAEIEKLNYRCGPIEVAQQAITKWSGKTLPPFDILFRTSAKLALADDSEVDGRPISRLELTLANEIRRAPEDRGFFYAALPRSAEGRVASDGSLADIEILRSFLRPSYWSIEDLVPSAWGGHIPFLYCLVPALRPRRYVELGTHYGGSFFAFCRAAKRSHLDTQGVAIDSWRGDEHAGAYDDSVFNHFKYVLKRYADIGEYQRMLFDDAARLFDTGSIDLLHIDGLHTYEAVRRDFELWLPKMSERGVILLHDVAEHERGFGVWELWTEIKKRYPCMEFLHGHGLGVAYVGDSGRSQLEPLLSLFNRSVAAREFLQLHFEEIAQKSAEIFLKAEEIGRKDQQVKLVALLNEEIAKLKQDLATSQAESSQLRRKVLRRQRAR